MAQAAGLTVAAIGTTGMVGAHILGSLTRSQSISRIHTITRREVPNDSKAVENHVSTQLNEWPGIYSSFSPPPSVFFSAMATTRGAAGGFDKQYAIEHDGNLAIAKAAKAAGTKVYVLISSASANSNSMFGYTKMKGELEENIKALNFDHTVILRPGLIGGTRDESRPAEAVLRNFAKVLGKVNRTYLVDGWVQDAEDIGKAAVKAGLAAANGENTEKVRILSGSDILALARS